MITLAHALESLKPNTSWIIRGQTYAGIEWMDSSEIPTEEEVLAEMERLQAEYDAKEYQRLRQPEYPPLADLADALYWQAQGDESKMTAYLQAVQAVKDKYPKGVA